MPEDLLDQPGYAWCMAGDRIVFLDTLRDRYFCLPETANRKLLHRLAIEPGKQWRQPAALPRPPSWRPPAGSYLEAQSGRFDLGQVARALWVQRRIERRIAARSLRDVLRETRTLIDRCSQNAIPSDPSADRCIRAFAQAKLLRSAADRCLARSIALAVCLASGGVRASVVIGVQLPPFMAHAWTQYDELVLNDSAEEARRFQPILVI